MARLKATKAREKLNSENEDGKRYAVVETKKKHTDKPILPPWYGKKDDNKRGF